MRKASSVALRHRLRPPRLLAVCAAVILAPAGPAAVANAASPDGIQGTGHISVAAHPDGIEGTG